MKQSEKEASEKIMELLIAGWINQPLYAITKLGIPDILSGGPKTVDEISQITETHAPVLYRILRALASIGFFHEEENQIFGLTPMGKILQEGKMQPIVLMFLSEWHSRAWGNLFHSVKTGDIPFNSAFGMPCFEWFKKNPEAADIFNKANETKAITSHIEITNVYDFSNVNLIVDIGGGYGGLLLHVLQKNPHMNGTVADLAYMKEKVEDQIYAMNLSARCVFAECDFFKKIPLGSDCYVLSNILHDWDDDTCEIILKNCSNAMRPDAKLLIIESIIPGRNEFSIACLLDIEVLVMGGGKERTEIEFRNLLDRSGFNLDQIIKTRESISILECTKH